MQAYPHTKFQDILIPTFVRRFLPSSFFLDVSCDIFTHALHSSTLRLHSYLGCSNPKLVVISRTILFCSSVLACFVGFTLMVNVIRISTHFSLVLMKAGNEIHR